MKPVVLENEFDAVVMLTWSDWHTEPRSNRYHFATRFEKSFPVFFVQLRSGFEGVEIEPLAEHNIIIVHIHDRYGREQSELLASVLAERGVRSPLLWIYNSYFEDFVRFCPAKLRVYHATEDYFYTSDSWTVAADPIQDQLRRVLQETDLVVAVSLGVAESYRTSGRYSGPLIVLRNGCDFEFWQNSGAFQYAPSKSGANTALFQGGINERLDIGLLQSLIEGMPDWQFWFCGENLNPPGWKQLTNLRNVKDFGFIESADIAQLAKQSLVGLIPYRQGELVARSLPLKAYEYVACGLPVVTVPIVGLAHRPDLFTQARTAEEFRAAIEAVARSRTDPAQVELRLAAAKAESYDQRFEELKGALRGILESRAEKPPQANILLVCECSQPLSCNIAPIEFLRRRSKHRIFLCDIGSINQVDKIPVSYFDGVIVHGSARSVLRYDLASGLGRALRQYIGPKLLLLQDRGEAREIGREWLEHLRIDTMVIDSTELSEYSAELGRMFPDIAFLPMNYRSGSSERHQHPIHTEIDALEATCIDQLIDRRIGGRSRARLICFPAFAAFGSEGPLEPLSASGAVIGWTDLADECNLDTYSGAFESVRETNARRAEADKALRLPSVLQLVPTVEEQQQLTSQLSVTSLALARVLSWGRYLVTTSVPTMSRRAFARLARIKLRRDLAKVKEICAKHFRT
jgi:glycosyltransferase involved in cell wall biosynthesis